jgi:hypothetical protein
MSEVSSEAASDLFASNSPPQLSPSPLPSTPPSKTHSHHQRTQNFFIAPPKLPSAQKKLYKSLPETSLKSEVEIDVDEVIGEYSENGRLYYFARYEGGIAHKVRNTLFARFRDVSDALFQVPIGALSAEVRRTCYRIQYACYLL